MAIVAGVTTGVIIAGCIMMLTWDITTGGHQITILSCVLTQAPQVVTIYQPLSLHMAHKTSDDL